MTYSPSGRTASTDARHEGRASPVFRVALWAAPVATLATLSALLGGCGGGGGGDGGTVVGTPPTVSTAYFTGVAMTPAAGDTLTLGFDTDVSLVAGALLTDEDFVLSSGTLGAVTAAPTLVNARTVRVTLGAGVTITPGATTIAFSDEQDAVQNSLGQLGTSGGVAETILAGDGDAPVISLVTLNEIPDELNGRGAAGGTLEVPQVGFGISVTATDTTSTIDSNETVINANVAVTVNGVARAAGANLRDVLTVTRSGDTDTFTVPANVVFTPGAVTISAQVVDTSGITSAVSTFTGSIGVASAANLPFETPQVWFLDLSRDLESVSISGPPAGATFNVAVTAGANGRGDFEDVMASIGLLSETNPNATNATVLSQVQTAITSKLNELFSGVNLSFTYTSPGVFPGESVAYADVGFSQICLAGASNASGSGLTLGAALFDTNNRFQDNNCLDAFQGSTRLGVFAFTLVSLEYGSGGPTTLFQQTFRPFTSAVLGGVPIGEDASDAARLADTVNDARATEIDNAIARFANLIALVTAHECGHSMGLVANGAMPTGLYGNDAANFPLSGGQPATNANGHIENQSLFSAGSTNVMSPALSFVDAQGVETAFNPLNLAYLRQQALYFQ